jgi:hypothetical protein
LFSIGTDRYADIAKGEDYPKIIVRNCGEIVMVAVAFCGCQDNTQAMLSAASTAIA